MRIDGVQPGNPFEKLEALRKAPANGQVPSFQDTLNTFLTDVNASQKESSEAQEKFLAGEITDVHQVMVKSEEATVAFNMLMELRNKTMDGYQELMRMRL